MLSTSVVYTDLVQCGSLRMQLNLEARPDTESVHLQTSIIQSDSSCRLRGRAPEDLNLSGIKSVQCDVRKTFKRLFFFLGVNINASDRVRIPANLD